MAFAKLRFSSSVTVQQKLKEIFRFCTGQIRSDSDLEFADVTSEIIVGDGQFHTAVTAVSKDGASDVGYDFKLKNLDPSKSDTTVTLTALGISARTINVTIAGTSTAFTSSSTYGLIYFKTAYSMTTWKSATAFACSVYAFADLTTKELIVSVNRDSVVVYTFGAQSGASFVANMLLPYELTRCNNVVSGGISNSALQTGVYSNTSSGTVTFSTNGNLGFVLNVDNWSTASKMNFNNINSAYTSNFDFTAGRHGIMTASYTAYPLLLADFPNGIPLINLSATAGIYIGSTKANMYYYPKPLRYKGANFEMVTTGTASAPRLLMIKRG